MIRNPAAPRTGLTYYRVLPTPDGFFGVHYRTHFGLETIHDSTRYHTASEAARAAEDDYGAVPAPTAETGEVCTDLDALADALREHAAILEMDGAPYAAIDAVREAAHVCQTTAAMATRNRAADAADAVAPLLNGIQYTIRSYRRQTAADRAGMDA